MEGDGYVAMDAGHFTGRRTAHGVSWEAIEGLGMSIFPVTAASVQPPKDSPVLEYKMFLFHSGPVGVTCRVAPTLNFVPGRGLRFAISWDDQPPQIMDALAHHSTSDWAVTVADSVRKVRMTFTLEKPGEHTLKFWMVDPAVLELLYDPQTSGGLLISLPEADAAALERVYPAARRVGRVLPRDNKPIRLI